jgi:hypothetical protein
LLEPFFVTHAETLLLVDDQQSQIAKLNVCRQDPVRANDNVDFPSGHFFHDRLQFLDTTGPESNHWS